ncbi:1-phosphatidylinositol 4,5-bisphosphate phosphodiesterase eta-1 [Gracilinanus agilis]|uniref:1-phosphatidylinositol 4,5-bisphosphate phosphodiesterase eta-1 n=1 Tax=Gracilinanus agilis TaxID=191870 RepID=UPI001CFC7636|nr:1-phosphatidylinositol 4,5-bisphosphate phosphodiesterase eta-1 [Gracilinanus agilis]
MSYWSLEKRNCVQYRRHFLVDNSVFHVERCMSVMQSGTQMIKLKSGSKGLVRLFYLDEHRTRLRWRPSRKSEKAKIIIDSIYKVTEGRQSEIFHRQAEGNFDPSCCFTIYHGNHMESLDLITSNPEEARTWITGLKYLMAGISDEDSLAKRRRTHDQYPLLRSQLPFSVYMFVRWEDLAAGTSKLLVHATRLLKNVARNASLPPQRLAAPSSSSHNGICRGIGGGEKGSLFSTDISSLSDGSGAILGWVGSRTHGPEASVIPKAFEEVMNYFFVRYEFEVMLRHQIDCWDGPDGEPVVHHGYTLTSKILFRDVVETINKTAFVKNEFPVILSIENHCSIQQQKKIARYLKEIFSDKLDLSSIDTGDSKQLPSPQSLKGKILVKGKKLPYHLGEDAEEGEVSDEDSADEIEDDCKFKLHYNNGTTDHQVESFIRKKLESLLKESQIRDKEDPDSFTVRALLKATHEGLNMHLKQNPEVKESGRKSHGRSLMSNFGKYKKTSKSRSKSNSTDDDEEGQHSGKEGGQLYGLGTPLASKFITQALVCFLCLFSSTCSGSPPVSDNGMEIIDPFVEVEIIGLPVDCCKEQTRVVDDNGFNPVWEETLTFTIHMPDIALVRFLVWDHDPIGRDFVGQRTVTFSSLVPGYRHVYLEGLTEASIFVHITINEIYGKWSPLILNPSYTILHFLGATKNRQLIGLRGLFNKNPKHNSSENSSHYVRKRSIGDRILRRTASAPAKGRKKSKMGFQEMMEMKDGVSEVTGSREKDGVLRRTTRSLQARPVSMPVDKSLLGGLSLPTSEPAKETEGKEKTFAENKANAESGKTHAKEQSLINLDKKLSSPSSTLHKNGSQVDAVVSLVDHALPLEEESGAPIHRGGNAQSDVPKDCQKSLSPKHLVSPRQPTSIRPAISDIGTKENGNIFLSETNRTLSGNAPSQSDLEMPNVKDAAPMAGSVVTSFSMMDISAVCSNGQDLHSTAIMQDSEISQLIDNITLTNESELGSSISALISQFDATKDQINLRAISRLPDISGQTHGMMSGHPSLLTFDSKTALKNNFSKSKPAWSSRYSSPETTVCSSPETTEYSTYTIIHEAALTPVPGSKFVDERNGKTNFLASEGGVAQPSPLSKSPQKNYGKDWENDATFGVSTSDDLTLDGIIDHALCQNSGESSLEEIGEDSQDLLVTTHEFKREDLSQLASPLKLKHCQETDSPCPKISGNGFFQPSALELSNHIQMLKTRSISCPAYQSAGFGCNNYFQCPEAPNNATCLPQGSDSQGLQQSACPLQARKQPSPCKSKSLGDLTSEDISCNFESKYQCISRSFITAGLRDKKSVPFGAKGMEPVDTLTEQLRKLVSLDQEDCGQVLGPRPEDREYPKALVRKLSSRSQSRVRNIASRAKERQEAGKQRSSPSGSGGGIVLRAKSSAPAQVVNRHSTGSYIAGYLNNLKSRGLEGRGIPEGACTSLFNGYIDQFCMDDSVLQTEPSSEDKPEIYFLLRL